MKNIFLVLFFALVTFTAQAKEIEVEAIGVGIDYDWALMNALDNAVKQTSEVTISRASPIQKMELNTKTNLGISATEHLDIDDGSLVKGKGEANYSGSNNAELTNEVRAELKEINAKYKGKINSYDVVNLEQKDGKYYVKIKAKVKQIDDYVSPDLVKKAKYSLSIVPFKVEKQIICLGKKVSATSFTNKISDILFREIAKSKKFNLVDRDNLDAYADELSLVNYNLSKEEDKSRLKNIASADYLLVGKIEDFSTRKTTQNVPMTGESYSTSSASVQVSYKLIETATMEVIASSVIDENLKKDGNFSSCNNIEKEFSKKIGHQISSEILTELFADYQPEVVLKKEVKKTIAVNKAQKPKPIKLPFD